MRELRQQDEVIRADRAEDLDPEAGSKVGWATLVGVLTTEVNVKNIKALLGFLGDRLGDQPIQMKIKVGNQEVSLEAKSRKDLLEAEPMIQNFRRRQQNLEQYRQVLLNEVEKQYPFDDHTQKLLKTYQQDILGLRDEDVADIWTEVITPLEETQSTEVENDDIEDELGGMEDGLSEDVLKLELPTPVPDIPKKIPQKTLELKTFEFDVVTLNQTGQEAQRQRKSAEYFTEDLGNGVTLDLVKIPAGEFLMGSPENEEGSHDHERPQHRVSLDSFFMGKYPITQAQWKAVASLPKLHRDLNRDPSAFKGENRPVERVSWYDAVEFCARLSKYTGKSYVLPSEAQWEYAARAKTQTPFHFGETISTDVANYNGTQTYGSGSKGVYRKETTPVDSFKVANNFGLFDRHGNVWEWCADPWHENYENAPTDGSIWDENVNDDRYKDYIDNLVNLMNLKSNIVLRGGSWINNPWVCRSAVRDYNLPRYGVNTFVGFRVVCVPGLF